MITGVNLQAMDSSTEFLKENNIFYSLTAPVYPATNGLVERYVGEFKDKLDKIWNTSETLQTTLDRFFADQQDFAHRLSKVTLSITYEQRH